MLYTINNINNDNQSQTLLDTMKRTITGSLICEIILALFHIPWLLFFTWWTVLCHSWSGIWYSGQSGVCNMNKSQYCDGDNYCGEGDTCNFNDDLGENDHLEYHCGDLRRYIFAVYINGLITILLIIILSIYKCSCCGTAVGSRNTNHSSWKYLQWVSLISIGCFVWLIIAYLKFVIDTVSSDDWAEKGNGLYIAIPFYLITFVFRSTIVFNIHKMLKFNKIKRQEEAAMEYALGVREYVNAVDPCGSGVSSHMQGDNEDVECPIILDNNEPHQSVASAPKV